MMNDLTLKGLLREILRAILNKYTSDISFHISILFTVGINIMFNFKLISEGNRGSSRLEI